jgi:hypothetical protein
MSTCSRCNISAWHPEARTCTIADCDLLAARVAAAALAEGVMITAPGVQVVARHLAAERGHVPPAADAFQATGRTLAASTLAPASAGGKTFSYGGMAAGSQGAGSSPLVTSQPEQADADAARKAPAGTFSIAAPAARRLGDRVAGDGEPCLLVREGECAAVHGRSIAA